MRFPNTLFGPVCCIRAAGYPPLYGKRVLHDLVGPCRAGPLGAAGAARMQRSGRHHAILRLHLRLRLRPAWGGVGCSWFLYPVCTSPSFEHTG